MSSLTQRSENGTWHTDRTQWMSAGRVLVLMVTLALRSRFSCSFDVLESANCTSAPGTAAWQVLFWELGMQR